MIEYIKKNKVLGQVNPWFNWVKFYISLSDEKIKEECRLKNIDKRRNYLIEKTKQNYSMSKTKTFA